MRRGQFPPPFGFVKQVSAPAADELGGEVLRGQPPNADPPESQPLSLSDSVARAAEHFEVSADLVTALAGFLEAEATEITVEDFLLITTTEFIEAVSEFLKARLPSAGGLDPSVVSRRLLCSTRGLVVNFPLLEGRPF